MGGFNGQETGFNNDGTKVRVYNPITGEIETQTIGDEGALAWNPAKDKTNWGYDPEGNRVLMATPEGYEDYGAFNDEFEGWQAGYQPPVTETVWDPDGLRTGPGDRLPPEGSVEHDDGTYVKTNTPPTTLEPEWDRGSSVESGGNGQSSIGDWNWADGQTGAPPLEGGGGEDPNDYWFDRYVPGQDSPWGIPEVEGGNKDFYRNQFVSLLRDDQNFRQRQREANVRQQDARLNPQAPRDMDWSWLDGGLPEVDVNDKGYASPVTGLTTGENWGYQDGGAAYRLDPTTGTMVSTGSARVSST